jgi:hypothetical protein
MCEDEYVKFLNEMGKDGWELVNIMNINNVLRHVFKAVNNVV